MGMNETDIIENIGRVAMDYYHLVITITKSSLNYNISRLNYKLPRFSIDTDDIPFYAIKKMIGPRKPTQKDMVV